MNCLTNRLIVVNLIAILSLCFNSANNGFAATDYIEHSVFRITNFQQRPDWKSPWKMKPTTKDQGSGFLIHDGFILTNAHVVSDSRMLLVNKFSSPNLFLADVVAIAHDSDLALLKVRDPDFYKNLRPLELGGVPELQSRVRAYGYPVGGHELSRTEGVVSRIEFGTYIHLSLIHISEPTRPY